MDNSALSKLTVSFGISLAVASVVNALLVVAKESSKSVMSGMQKITGHHWVSHGAIVLALFAGLGWWLGRARGGQGPLMTANRLIATVAGGVILSGLIIVGYYLIGD